MIACLLLVGPRRREQPQDAPARLHVEVGEDPGVRELHGRPDAGFPGDERAILLQMVLYPGQDADASSVNLARKVAGELLRSAGVHIEWCEDVLAANALTPALVSNMRGRAGGVNRVVLGVGLGHVLGLTIAHEVGHILGLPHARSGVMKAAPEAGELEQLRTSRLTFLPSEAARMQQAMVARVSRVVAAAR